MDDVDLSAIRERVGRGARLLDERRPGWAMLVNLDRLAMRDCNRCILGQVYGSFLEGVDILFTEEEFNSDREVETGFNADMPDSDLPDQEFIRHYDLRDQELKQLAEAWRDEVRHRVMK